jgi:hypothetical protein
MNGLLLLTATGGLIVAAPQAVAADAAQAKAIDKHASQWYWKQSQDAFLKANKDTAGNELAGSDKDKGDLLYPARRSRCWATGCRGRERRPQARSRDST